MKKLINRITGSEMWVTEERLDYYLGQGHMLSAPAPAKKAAFVTKQPEPVKKTRKK